MLNSKVNPSEFTEWALPPITLQWLKQFIIKENIKNIIECGSGLSTIFLGELKEKNIIERSMSLEHNAYWHDYVSQLLKNKSLEKHTDVKLTPLIDYVSKGGQFSWYDISAIHSFQTNLLIIDGPPGGTCPFARYPAPIILKEFIAKGAYILLDDYFRAEEKEIVKQWVNLLPCEIIEVLEIGKGLALLQYKP